jgi:ubiquinone/menaquinone biosynthesis C-methylase UbiE
MRTSDWDRLAEFYEDQVLDIFVRDRENVIVRWMRARGLLRGRKTVMDVGCGVGSFFKRYGRHFGKKTGVDHSRRMLQIAARRCHAVPGCEWRQGNIEHLPVSLHDSADLLICSNVITFNSLAACRRAMRAIIRYAKVGGWFLITLPALESHDAAIAYETGRTRRQRRTDSAIVRRDDRLQRFVSAEGARRLATQAGLRSVRIQKVWYPWIDEGIAKPPPGCELPWCWLVTGQR